MDILREVSKVTSRKLPLKYFKGLKTPSAIRTRARRIIKGIKDPKNFSPFSTDKDIKTKSSSYTQRFMRVFPDTKSLPNKAKATGVPLPIIKKVYNKGLAAWRTGHRPGATAQQWGYARVHSFLMMGKTVRTADKVLYEEAIMKMDGKDTRRWKSRIKK